MHLQQEEASQDAEMGTVRLAMLVKRASRSGGRDATDEEVRCISVLLLDRTYKGEVPQMEWRMGY